MSSKRWQPEIALSALAFNNAKQNAHHAKAPPDLWEGATRDRDGVDIPPRCAHRLVCSQPEAQRDGLSVHGRSQINHRCDVAPRMCHSTPSGPPMGCSPGC